MANIKISELTEKTTVGLNDLFPIVDATTNETKKITGANLVSNQYSTSETKTNMKWLDGKPVYRKVLNISQLPVPASINGYIYSPYDIEIMDLDNIINMYGCYNSSNNRKYPINVSSLATTEEDTLIVDAEISTWVQPLYSNNWRIMIMVKKTKLLTTGYVVIEYTKTTDV